MLSLLMILTLLAGSVLPVLAEEGDYWGGEDYTGYDEGQDYTGYDDGQGYTDYEGEGEGDTGAGDSSFTLDVTEPVMINTDSEWTDITVQCSELTLGNLSALEVRFFAGSFWSDATGSSIPFQLGDEDHDMPSDKTSVEFTETLTGETISVYVPQDALASAAPGEYSAELWFGGFAPEESETSEDSWEETTDPEELASKGIDHGSISLSLSVADSGDPAAEEGGEGTGEWTDGEDTGDGIEGGDTGEWTDGGEYPAEGDGQGEGAYPAEGEGQDSGNDAESGPSSYYVIWTNEEGTEIYDSQESTDPSAEPTTEVKPVKEGYTFSHWDEGNWDEYKTVKTYIAVFEPAGEQAAQTEQIAQTEQNVPIQEEAPILNAPAPEQTEGETNTAESVTRTVKWRNWDGTELKSEPYTDGDGNPVPPEDPTRSADEEYTYTFSGWKDEGWNKDNTIWTFTAQYEAKPVEGPATYTVIWRDNDEAGTELGRKTYEEGNPEPEPDPEIIPKEKMEGEDVYIFTGWDNGICNSDTEKIYTAQYAKKLTVEWRDWDTELLASVTYAEGQDDPAPPADPVREADADNTYVFSGWKDEGWAGSVRTFTAQYEAQPIKVLTVEWHDWDDTLLNSATYKDGEDEPAPPADPNREEDEEYTYTFTKWRDDGWNAEKTVRKYTAEYQPSPKKKTYTVVWQSNGTVLESQTYKDGEEEPKPTITPTDWEDSNYYYTYVKWDKGVWNEAHTVKTYTALFKTKAKPKPAPNTITVIWRDYNNATIDLKTYKEGSAEPKTSNIPPTRKDDDQYSYTFIGWDAGVWNETHNVKTYTAQYQAKLKPMPTLTIVWKNGDGSTLDTKTFVKGEQEPLTDKIPVKAEDKENKYVFAGWDKGKIEGNTKTYTPQFATVKKESGEKHTVTFYTSGGSSIPPQAVKDGEKATKPADPTKNGFTFGGWFTDATFKTAYDFNQPVKANLVLFAKWDGQPLTALSYTPAEGNSLAWAKGSGLPLTITVKRSINDTECFSHFVNVQIDGATLVNGTDYVARPGSTIIILQPAALEKLSVASHTVRVNFNDGLTDVKLAVNASSNRQNGVQTGDTSGILIWGIVLACAAGLTAFLLYRRKRV